MKELIGTLRPVNATTRRAEMSLNYGDSHLSAKRALLRDIVLDLANGANDFTLKPGICSGTVSFYGAEIPEGWTVTDCGIEGVKFSGGASPMHFYVNLDRASGAVFQQTGDSLAISLFMPAGQGTVDLQFHKPGAAQWSDELIELMAIPAPVGNEAIIDPATEGGDQVAFAGMGTSTGTSVRSHATR